LAALKVKIPEKLQLVNLNSHFPKRIQAIFGKLLDRYQSRNGITTVLIAYLP